MIDRFVTDSSLERVARRLRLLGFDVASTGADGLDRVFAAARSTDAIVLTTSVRHPRRYAGVRAFRVDRDAAAAVRGVCERFQPAGAPYSRCSVCNVALERLPSARAAGRAPVAVTVSRETLDHCPQCGRWYWPGSHVERMRAWFAEARVSGTPG